MTSFRLVFFSSFRLFVSEELAGSIFRVSTGDDGTSTLLRNICMPVYTTLYHTTGNLENSITYSAEFIKIQTHAKRF